MVAVKGTMMVCREADHLAAMSEFGSVAVKVDDLELLLVQNEDYLLAA